MCCGRCSHSQWLCYHQFWVQCCNATYLDIWDRLDRTVKSSGPLDEMVAVQIYSNWIPTNLNWWPLEDLMNQRDMAARLARLSERHYRDRVKARFGCCNSWWGLILLNWVHLFFWHILGVRFNEFVRVYQLHFRTAAEDAWVIHKYTASPHFSFIATSSKDALVVQRVDDLQLEMVKCFFPLSIQHQHIHVQQTHQRISSVLNMRHHPIGPPWHDLHNAWTVSRKSFPQYMLGDSSDVFQGTCKHPLVTNCLPFFVKELEIAWCYHLL